MICKCVLLAPADFEALENSFRAHRSAALLVPGAPEPMAEFQKDLLAAGERLGLPAGVPGSYSVQLHPGGQASLCCEVDRAATRH